MSSTCNDVLKSFEEVYVFETYSRDFMDFKLKSENRMW